MLAQEPGSETLDSLYKIVVVGDIGTGKTSFIRRVTKNDFTESYKATIGVDFLLKSIETQHLQLWDIAGQERFGNMTRIYYKHAVGGFLLFDVTRHSTFEAVAKWKQDIDQKVRLPNGDPLPVVLLANKVDLPRPLSETMPDTYCKENGFIGWFATSAKENINIDEAVRLLVANLSIATSTSSTPKPNTEGTVEVLRSSSGSVRLQLPSTGSQAFAVRQPLPSTGSPASVARQPLPSTGSPASVTRQHKHSKDRGLNILAIDGGGIRGIVPLKFLLHLEKETGKKIRELFDFIGGTSTGGIITLGHVYGGQDIEDLLQLYSTLGREIFAGGVVTQATRAVTSGARYSNAPLKKQLVKLVGESELSSTTDPKVFVVATTSSTEDPRPYLFRNYSYKGETLGTSECHVWEAGLATAAAHTYFPVVEIGKGLFRDGGVVANNPAEIAIQEAKALFPGRRINCVVSLGTGEAAQKPAGKGITDALKQIVLAATSSQIINSRAKHVCKRDGIPFYRFNVSIDVGLADTDEGAISAMVGASDIALHDCRSELSDLAGLLVPPGSKPTPIHLKEQLLKQMTLTEEVINTLLGSQLRIHFDMSSPTLREIESKIVNSAESINAIFETDALRGMQLKLAAAKSLTDKLEITLAVLGTLNAGKSTLINALIGKEIMPHRDLAMTALPTIVTLSPQHSIPVLEIPNVDFYNDCLEYIRTQADLIATSRAEWRAKRAPWSSIIEDIADGVQLRFESRYEGEDEIRTALTRINDVTRAVWDVEYEVWMYELNSSREAKAPSSEQFTFTRNPSERLAFPDDYPRVLTTFGHLNNLEEGTRISLVDCPGHNEMHYPVGAIVNQVMAYTNAVLPVLNYTTLSAANDPAFEDQISTLFRRLKNNFYVVVNKYDQSDGHGMQLDDTKRFVANTLLNLSTEVHPQFIMPVSAKLAFFANHVRQLLASRDHVERSTDWVTAKFYELAFGSMNRKPKTREKLIAAAEDMYQQSHIGEVLHSVIGRSLHNIAPVVLGGALKEVRETIVPPLRSGCQLRLDFLQTSSKDLEEAQRRLEEQNKLIEGHREVFDKVKSNVREKLKDRLGAIRKERLAHLQKELARAFSDQTIIKAAQNKGLTLSKTFFTKQTKIYFSSVEERDELLTNMTVAFETVNNGLEGIQQELQNEAQHLYEIAAESLRRQLAPTLEAINEVLRDQIHSSVTLTELPHKAIKVDAPNLDSRTGLFSSIVDWLYRCFNGDPTKWAYSWTLSTMRSAVTTQASDFLSQIMEDTEDHLMRSINRELDAIFKHFYRSLQMLEDQIKLCQQLRAQVEDYQKQTDLVRACLLSLTDVTHNLDQIEKLVLGL